MTSRTVISIVAPPDLIRELQKSKNDEIRMTEPVRIGSSTGMMNAPVNPDEVKVILELVKVMLETGAAALTFYMALLAIVRELNTPVAVKDPETGETKIIVKPTTSEEEIKEKVDE